VRTCRNWLKRARVLGSGLLSGLDQTAHLVPARELLITALRALIPRKPTASGLKRDILGRRRLGRAKSLEGFLEGCSLAGLESTSLA
jgi:hypothetical protein